MAELPILTTTHGLTRTRAYAAFHAMHTRCYNPNSTDYRNYGGRGITVCRRWRRRDGLLDFVADMGQPPPGTTLDRINNSGNYEPGNCRWATLTQQAHNKRNSRLITWRNKTMTLTEWAKSANRHPSFLHKRLARLPLHLAMEPIDKGARNQ